MVSIPSGYKPPESIKTVVLQNKNFFFIFFFLVGVCVCGFAADFPCRTFLQHSRYIAIQPGFPQPAEPPLINLPRSKGDVSAAASAPLREEVSVAWRRERPGSQPGSSSPSPSLPDPGAPSEQLCANRSGSGSADVSGLMPVVPDTGLLGIVAV